MALTLVIGNKNYSSWSLRPWLALRQSEIVFSEVRIALYTPTAESEIKRYSPAGKVPVLIDGDVTIWDSLAILEFLAEQHPHLQLWPADPAARARARAVSAEMHSGFAALRAQCGMNLRRTYPPQPLTPEVTADVARVQSVWEACLAASQGPFLFGSFGNADAMFAPVVTRFVTYSIAVSDRIRGYMDRMLELPAMQEWYRSALAETEVIPQYER